MSEQIFEQMRDEMSEKWQAVSVTNYQYSKQLLLEQLKVMDALIQLHEVEIEGENETEELFLNKWKNFEEGFQKDSNQSVKNDLIVNNELKKVESVVKTANREETKEKEDGKVYTFQRNLQGGILPAIKGFVPEGIVRKLDVEHGDLVKATLLPSAEGRPPRYLYELVEKLGKAGMHNRLQFNYCPVENQAGRLLVSKSGETGSLLKVDGELFSHLFSDYEIEEFELKEGDLVDIAVFSDNLASSRLIWRHKNIETTTGTIDTLSSDKLKDEKIKEESVGEEVELALQGLSIMVIGELQNKPQYEYEIEKAGGVLNMVDGKQKGVVIQNQMEKSDYVVCLVGKCSDQGEKAAKDAAKSLGVPFLPCWSKSAKHVVKTIELFMHSNQADIERKQ